MITGWDFARDGKKATSFDSICRALGVEFNFHRASERVLEIYNTKQRVEGLVSSSDSVIVSGKLTKQEGLVLRGRLGFANSCLHGRHGNLVLKLLVEHSYM